jgi:hypothetical protein
LIKRDKANLDQSELKDKSLGHSDDLQTALDLFSTVAEKLKG